MSKVTHVTLVTHVTRVTCAVIALLVAAACDPDAPAPIRHPDRYTVWAEYMTPEQVDAYFTFAGAEGLNVNVAVKQGEHDRDYLAAVCEAARKNDVALRLWPLLTEENGYWANQANVETFIDYVTTAASGSRCPIRWSRPLMRPPWRYAISLPPSTSWETDHRDTV